MSLKNLHFRSSSRVSWNGFDRVFPRVGEPNPDTFCPRDEVVKRWITHLKTWVGILFIPKNGKVEFGRLREVDSIGSKLRPSAEGVRGVGDSELLSKEVHLSPICPS